MKRIFSTGIITLGLLLLLTACISDPVSNEKNILFKADFNDLPAGSKPADLTLSEEKGAISIVEDPLMEGGILFMEDLGEKNVKIQGTFPSQPETVTVFIDFMQPKRGNTAKVIRLFGTEDSDKAAIRIETKDKNISYKMPDGSFVYMAPSENGKWYTVQIVADILSQTANVFVNGKMGIEGAPFQAPASDLSRFDCYTPGTSATSHYIDNLVILKGVVPVTYIPRENAEEKPEVKVNAEPVPATASEGSSTIYEAEDAQFTGCIVDIKHNGFTGDGFVDFKPNQPGGTIKWKVEAEKVGEATLIFRYAHAEGNRPLEVSVNGTIIAESLEFQGTGDWATWEEVSIKTLLKAGSNEVMVKAVGADGGGNIDHLEVAYGDSGFSAVYEAESGISSMTIVDIKHSGFTGDGFIDFKPNQPGGTIEWTVDVPEAGIYTLQFRYAHAEGNRPLEVQVNGEVVEKELAFLGTGDWANWQTVSTAAELKKGKNTIIVKAIGADGGGNIDHLKILGGVEESDEIVIDFKQVDSDAILSASLKASLEQQGLFLSDGKASQFGPGDYPQIESAVALTERIIMVTFDSGFLKAEPKDILITAALGEWNSLNPKLTYIPTVQAAAGANREGKSVFLYQLEEPYQSAIQEKEASFYGDLEAAREKAHNLITWQMPHGGWDKNNTEMTKRSWDGREPRSGWFAQDGTELGTIDNNATINEIRYIAEVYRETGEKELKDSVTKGIDFLLTLQHEKGGFPQVYPERDAPGGPTYYSNYATFNDGAMMNALILFDDIINRRYPFDSDTVDSSYNRPLQSSIDKGVDFILKSQIKVKGKLTAWCAQHDPETYAPMGARAYEHPSISGYESVNVVKFLMGRPNQTPEIRRAVDAALSWLNEVKMEQTSYISADPNKKFFIFDPNGTAWYRFYDLKTMEPIFSGRDGVIKRSIEEIEEERQNGYSWGGSWPRQLLRVAQSTGYFEGKFFAQVVGTDSSDYIGRRLMLENAEEIKPFK